MKKSEEKKDIGASLDRLKDFLENLDELAERKTKIRRVVEGKTTKVEGEISIGHLATPPEEPRRDRQKPRKESESSKGEGGKKQPLVDFFDRDDHLLVVASLPGVEEEDLNLSVQEGRTLVVSGKENGKEIERKITLPQGGAHAKILDAGFKNGVLRVTLSKSSKTERKDV